MATRSRIAQFRPLYQECAAPEAIRADLTDLRRKRSTIDGQIAKLEKLLVARTRQIQRGEWPPTTETEE